MQPHPEPTDRFIAALGQAGHRLTGPRRAVAELIAERAGHFTAEELLAAAQRRKLDLGRATIFRSLDLFSELGLVERVDLPSGQHAYVSCSRGNEHHHHIVCSSCGRASGFDDGALGEAVEAAVRRTGYEVQRHRLELFGICPDCQARPRGAH